MNTGKRIARKDVALSFRTTVEIKNALKRKAKEQDRSVGYVANQLLKSGLAPEKAA